MIVHPFAYKGIIHIADEADQHGDLLNWVTVLCSQGFHVSKRELPVGGAAVCGTCADQQRRRFIRETEQDEVLMGLYIETGTNSRKASWLVNNYGAFTINVEDYDNLPLSWHDIRRLYPNYLPVCVVYNRDFEAAGVATDADEFERFKVRPDDTRPRIWLLVRKVDIEKLTGTRL